LIHRQFEAIGGWNQLKEVIGTLGATSQLTRLVPDLKGIDPDDAFSSVPYEKGFAFLYYLETLVGGPGNLFNSLDLFIFLNHGPLGVFSIVRNVEVYHFNFISF